MVRWPVLSDQKNFHTPPGLGTSSFQKNATFLRSFSFFIKEQNVFCILSCCLLKNGTIFAFFPVLYKRTERSLQSFAIFIKEWNNLCVLLRSFWFHKSYKNCKSRKKKNVKELSVLFIRLKKNVLFFFNIYLYIYIYIYLSFCFLLHKNETFSSSFSFFIKEWKIFVFFPILCKRMEHSLRSFPFFWKDRERTFRSFGSHKSQKTRKKERERTERSLKEQNEL